MLGISRRSASRAVAPKLAAEWPSYRVLDDMLEGGDRTPFMGPPVVRVGGCCVVAG